MFSLDLAFALRQLAKRPGLAATIILIMAAGVGVNAAIFSVVNAVLLKPLPYADPDRLVFISGTSGTGEKIPISYPDFRDWRAQQHSFDAIAAYNVQNFNLLINGETQHFAGAFITANYFQTLGLVPTIGRTFLENEDKSGSDRVVMLSERLWREQFGSDPKVLGRTIVMNAITYHVIGIAPDKVMHPANIDLYASLGPFSNYPMWADRGNPTLYAIGRLKPAVSLSAANADLRLICKGLEARYLDTNAGHSVIMTSLLDTTVAEYRATLYLLCVAAGSVLLICCANIAGLQLSRTNDRRKELVIRTALGASRGDIIRQLLTENVILCLAGGALGILTAYRCNQSISYLFPRNVSWFETVHLDFTVIGVMAGITISMGVLSGLIPALKASKIDPNHTLKQHQGISTTAERNRSQQVLVVSQIAIVTLLLTGTGLLIQTLQALHRVEPGFDPHHLMIVGLKLPGVRYRDRPEDQATPDMANLYAHILEKVKAVPGVDSAAISDDPPFVHIPVPSRWPFGITGQPDVEPGNEPFAEYQSVSNDYFHTMRLPLLRGRPFDNQDVFGKPLVAIIDMNFANRFFPGQDPIGKQINDAGPVSSRQQYRIVGVVPAVRHDDLGAEPRLVQIYVSAAQSPNLQVRLLVRTLGEPSALVQPIRRAVHAVDPEVPVFDARTMTEALSSVMATQQLAMDLISFFSLLALGLAVLGLYGILTHTVSQRVREIGIRVALGASRQHVLGFILKEGMILVALGLLLGLLLESVLGPVFRGFLYQVTPADPAVLLSAAAIFTAIAFVACLVPALRAANLDPIDALRES
ncbi:MAG: ABC transporter permease [Verrucomicrobia bacterium]|nr:ABC transporter permease [Verrucomicrobiota bacterium]